MKKIKQKKTKQWIVCSFSSNFIYGAFFTAADAAQWAMKHMSKGSAWYIRRITKP